MKLGRNLARTFLDYYKLQNHIIINPVASISSKLQNNNSLYNIKNNMLNQNSSQNIISLNECTNQLSNSGNKITKRSPSNISQSLKPLLPLSAKEGQTNSSISPVSNIPTNIQSNEVSNNCNKQPNFFLENELE